MNAGHAEAAHRIAGGTRQQLTGEPAPGRTSTRGGVLTTSPDRRAPFRAGGEVRGMPLLEGASAATYLCDVSEFQANVVDAAYLAWSKAIIIRACYGDAHDDAAWYGGQRRALLHSAGARFVGIYQYLAGGQSGAAQAQAFHRLVGAIQPGEVFIADFEEGSRSVLDAWHSEMLALYGQSVKPYLWTYTGLYFGQQQNALPVEWLADYTSVEPSSPHTLWQFSDRYSVPGVGTCDASVYRGTIDQLAGLAYQPGRPAPAPSPVPAPSPSPPYTWENIDMAKLPVLKQGATDKTRGGFWYVHRLQALIKLDGQLQGLSGAAGITVDGDYGPATAQAVREVEQRYGLTVDAGIAGQQVWSKLLGV